MPESLIRLDADIEQVTFKFKKVGDEAARVGEKAAKAFDFTGGLTKTLNALPAKLLTVAAAVEAVGKAVDAANNVADRRADLGRKANQFQLSAAQAGARLGGNAGSNTDWISNASGSTSQSGRLQFAESIARIQEERRAKGMPVLKDGTVQSFLGYYGRGGDIVNGAGGADLIDSINQFPYNPELGVGRRLASRLGKPYKGQGINDLIDANMATTSQTTRRALDFQTASGQLEAEELGVGLSQEGQTAAAGQAARDMSAVRHPWATELIDTAKSVPVIGRLAKYGQRKVNESQGAETLEALKAIRESNETMARRAGPALPNYRARDDGHAPRPEF